MTPGDFNARQKFDPRGLLWQIMEMTGGGYRVARFDKADCGHCTIASEALDTVEAAVAEAERLRKAALT